jgi:hypothetical protein
VLQGNNEGDTTKTRSFATIAKRCKRAARQRAVNIIRKPGARNKRIKMRVNGVAIRPSGSRRACPCVTTDTVEGAR